MTTLRARLTAAFDAAAAVDWWRADADGRVAERGSAPPARWPAADRVELAIAAEDAPILALALPPLDDARRAAAAAFALDDRVAVPVESLAIRAPAPVRPGAPVLARIVDRALLDRVAAAFPRAQRIVAEADLVAADDGWHWCADRAGRGFVRRADGSAFAVQAAPGEVPPELAAALERERRGGRLPDAVVVDAPFAAPATIVPGVAGRAGRAWSPADAPARRWAEAPDLRVPQARAADASSAPRPSWRWAIGFAAAAGVAYAASLGAEYARDRHAAWRDGRALVELARGAGIDATEPRQAADALARQAAVHAHAAGRAADGDLLPLLARAAPALGSLPPGTVRSLAYADRRLVVDLAGLDATRGDRLLDALAAAGLRPVAAPAAGGLRIALTPGP